MLIFWEALAIRLLKGTDGQSRCKHKMNVYKLAVVEESISVLNVSRMEIKENR